MTPKNHPSFPSRPVVDQAHGLRQMFQARVVRFVPVVSNPDVIYGGLLLERLCTALASLGLKTLVLDAGERARPPSELAAFDLREGLEVLSSHVSYLPGRGLTLKHVDAQGCSASLMDAACQASPHSDVVILHAPAAELVRVMGHSSRGSQVRPLVFTDDNPEGLTRTYSAIKVMAHRARWMSYDLMLCAGPDSVQARTVAERLAHCADNFLGVAQRDWVVLNPLESAHQDPARRFVDMTHDLLRCALCHSPDEWQHGQALHLGAALPSRLTPVFN